jgi:molybdopterin synthase sulfur carrier subunit
MIKVLYFSRLKEALGCAEEQVTLQDTLGNTGELLAMLQSRGEPWASTLEQKPLLIAVNQSMADLQTDIKSGDEVAFFPPVTGG